MITRCLLFYNDIGYNIKIASFDIIIDNILDSLCCQHMTSNKLCASQYSCGKCMKDNKHRHEIDMRL